MTIQKNFRDLVADWSEKPKYGKEILENISEGAFLISFRKGAVIWRLK